jgi:hypothetical protein
MTAGVFAVVSPSAVNLPPTHSVDITDWVGAGDAEGQDLATPRGRRRPGR